MASMDHANRQRTMVSVLEQGSAQRRRQDERGILRIVRTFAQAVRKAIVPRLLYSQQLYEKVLFDRVRGKDSWLDLGCGRGLLPHWRGEQEKELIRQTHRLVGLDYDLASLKDNKTLPHKLRGDVSRLPFRDGCFDLVTANMAFEHLKEPEIQLKEIFRVLKPGGELVFHTPNAHGYGPLLAKVLPESLKDQVVWWLQRRKSEDVFPTFYRINIRTEIQQLASLAGFEVVLLKMILSTPLFTMVPSLLIVELFWLRALMTKWGRLLRSNIIAILKKPKHGR